MTFQKGESLYTSEGTYVSFDHAVGETAYVRPVLTRIIQATTYSGDDFHEEEDEFDADHLIDVPLAGLSKEKPSAKLDEDIAGKKAELAELRATIEREESARRRGAYAREQEIKDGEKKLAEWREKFETFDMLGHVMEGGEVFPLSVRQLRHAATTCSIPVIPDISKVKLLRIRPIQKKWPYTGQVKNPDDPVKWEAVPTADHRRYSSGDIVTNVHLFKTEQERTEYLTELFDKVVAEWSKTQNFGASDYSNDLDYGSLCKWVEKFPHLEMPEHIVRGKELADEAAKQARIDAARKRLEELEAEA
ncbi:hypothetical protein RPALISO_190 [Ruegeria phage RpAliso]|nr:hypothetical protein RPALISO_190 [Ruegeria phage RpAliso]